MPWPPALREVRVYSVRALPGPLPPLDGEGALTRRPTQRELLTRRKGAPEVFAGALSSTLLYALL